MKNRELTLRLTAVALVLAFGFALLLSFRTESPVPEQARMMDAARRAEAAFAAIKEERLRRGLSISEENDRNGTGLIGEPYTGITTTSGNIEAKRTSTNPNSAALVVRLLCEAGVRPGDRIAVNCSGSFPALNIAVLCAMDAMDLEGVVFSSVGASTYGANLEEFTYQDMEHVLFQRGLIRRVSDHISLGGAEDQGMEFPEETKEAICDRLTGLGYVFWNEPDLETNVRRRLEAYGEAECFVNVGGNLVSTGGSASYDSGSGILRNLTSRKGLIGGFLERGVPVVHLLNLRALFPRYGLPVDPTPLPKAGEGGVYTAETVSRPGAVLLLMSGLAGLAWAVHGRVKRQPL